MKGTDHNSEKIMTPEPVREWIRQQADLSLAERDELARDMEVYFAQRGERIAAEKKL